MWLPLALFLGAGILSYLAVALIRSWALRSQVLDVPNERSSHTCPMPRGGGLAIVLVTLGGGLSYALLDPTTNRPALLAYVVGAILISVISWLDDLRSLPNLVRFAAHSLGAVFVIWGIGYWETVGVPFLGQVDPGLLGLPLTFLWIVGLTNAYNFMDGIDGIAGGQAVVTGLGWVVMAWLVDDRLVGILALLLAAGSLGFLGHNWPPARIFMGDVGAAFLGFSYAVLPVIAARDNPWLVLAGVLPLWPFVFDAVFTFIRRLRSGENVFAAHRSHLYQRLVITRLSHRFVTLLYMCLAIIGVCLALIWIIQTKESAVAVSTVVPVLGLALWAAVVRRER